MGRLIAVDLDLGERTPKGHRLPAGLPAVVPVHLPLRSGGGLQIAHLGMEYQGVADRFGLSPAVDQEVLLHPLQPPAPEGHGLQMVPDVRELAGCIGVEFIFPLHPGTPPLKSELNGNGLSGISLPELL